MKNLAHLAFKSQDTFGRALPAKYDRDRNLYPINPFILDLIKIQCSKALRRLKGKTQVITFPENVNIRDRLVHSFEVASLSLSSGGRLGLNIPLLQAGSLGHDLGHVPFGHLGENFLSKKLGEKFRHEKFAIFVLEMVERSGDGLNLSYETLNAILNHSRGSGEMDTRKSGVLENDIIMFCDKLSYIFSDYNDICRMGYNFVLPEEISKLGDNQSEGLNKCLFSLCKESILKQQISFEDSKEAKLFKTARDFMYQEVYYKMKTDDTRFFLQEVLEGVFNFFENLFGDKRQAVLAIALSSEDDICSIYSTLKSDKAEKLNLKIFDIKEFSIAEILPRIAGLAEFNFCNPDKFMDKNNFGKISKAECFAF